MKGKFIPFSLSTYAIRTTLAHWWSSKFVADIMRQNFLDLFATSIAGACGSMPLERCGSYVHSQELTKACTTLAVLL